MAKNTFQCNFNHMQSASVLIKLLLPVQNNTGCCFSYQEGYNASFVSMCSTCDLELKSSEVAVNSLTS